MSTSARRMHDDFAGLEVSPGTMQVPDGLADAFAMVNLLALGGEADRPAHVPEAIGGLGDVVIWESTGSSVALPFWNTNYAGDVYLYLVHGQVRVEFKEPEKEPEGDAVLGHYEGRTGDMMLLPKAIAHRTFSTNGLRRISLEIVRRNPLWERIGEHADVAAATDLTIGGLRFEPAGDEVVIHSPEGRTTTPAAFLLRGLRALVAYELHLDHNEFEGGFVVHDRGEVVRLATSDGYDAEHDPREVLAVFTALIDNLQN